MICIISWHQCIVSPLVPPDLMLLYSTQRSTTPIYLVQVSQVHSLLLGMTESLWTDRRVTPWMRKWICMTRNCIITGDNTDILSQTSSPGCHLITGHPTASSLGGCLVYGLVRFQPITHNQSLNKIFSNFRPGIVITSVPTENTSVEVYAYFNLELDVNFSRSGSCLPQQLKMSRRYSFWGSRYKTK